ncbi:hypothetical protein [Niveispirillum sp.]|uniref:hypothetical protein n=1 Tax=Niveispirillum sp. TaxID=1917217 RepID=UPI001B7A402B|nr:hypothetical protein [Niveispirillum sp.]MBP7337688.1 hypothetical protein [Niveispirillum sp.]
MGINVRGCGPLLEMTDAESGVEVPYQRLAREMRIVVGNGRVSIELDAMAECHLVADGLSMRVLCPRILQMRAVKAVLFADGEIVDYSALPGPMPTGFVNLEAVRTAPSPGR